MRIAPSQHSHTRVHSSLHRAGYIEKNKHNNTSGSWLLEDCVWNKAAGYFWVTTSQRLDLRASSNSAPTWVLCICGCSWKCKIIQDSQQQTDAQRKQNLNKRTQTDGKHLFVFLWCNLLVFSGLVFKVIHRLPEERDAEEAAVVVFKQQPVGEKESAGRTWICTSITKNTHLQPILLRVPAVRGKRFSSVLDARGC